MLTSSGETLSSYHDQIIGSVSSGDWKNITLIRRDNVTFYVNGAIQAHYDQLPYIEPFIAILCDRLGNFRSASTKGHYKSSWLKVVMEKKSYYS